MILLLSCTLSNKEAFLFYDDFKELNRGPLSSQVGAFTEYHYLPVNWTGASEEFFVHNPNVDQGGMFDGWRRKVAEFADDGHPDMCNAVLDITGDCRDEIVVWDPNEIWVYTQDNNPIQGKIYRPTSNPLYNYSNCQATVSLPGWSN